MRHLRKSKENRSQVANRTDSHYPSRADWIRTVIGHLAEVEGIRANIETDQEGVIDFDRAEQAYDNGITALNLAEAESSEVSAVEDFLQRWMQSSLI